jgi:hypothetical protein
MLKMNEFLQLKMFLQQKGSIANAKVLLHLPEKKVLALESRS